MSLSKTDRETVEELAKRLSDLVNAMTEARYRLSNVPQDQLAKLHGEIIEGEQNEIHTPEENNLDITIRALEENVKRLSRRNTSNDAMEMLKVANAGAMMMNSHVKLNYPRLAIAVRNRTTDLHSAYFRKRLEEDGRILPDGRVRIGNHISADPIPDCRAGSKNPDYFQPSEATRSSRRPITFDEFERLDGKDLFDTAFFIQDLDNAQNLTAFQLTGRKDTRNGLIYEVRWEGTSRAMDVPREELKELAEQGLWFTRTPQA